MVDTVMQGDIPCPCNRESKGDCLGIAVAEFLIRRFWENEQSPRTSELWQRSAPKSKLFDHFIAEQSTKACTYSSQLLGSTRRYRTPAKKVSKKPEQGSRCRKRRACSF